MSTSRHRLIKCALILTMATISIGAVEAYGSGEPKVARPVGNEDQRKNELQSRLCRVTELDCNYVTSVFRDPRLLIYPPPAPAPVQPPSRSPKEREKNPYFTKRFGLLSPESLERCRAFISEHAPAFADAYEKYGVPNEIICGHLRIETDFGIPTKLSPKPLGTRPAINQLISLYVRDKSPKDQKARFVRRQEFAFAEIRKLVAAAKMHDWDLFGIPGSPTGAIGLVQFEPSSFSVAVDGDGDGSIDLFSPDDAILSIAHYLVTRGWDHNLEHQRRAIFAYYGGHYDQDPNKFYMKAVLKYASEVRAYLEDHPLERAKL